MGKKVTSSRLISLRGELKKIQNAERYLQKEKERLVGNKESVRIKIKKELEVIKLEGQISRVRNRKK